MPLSLPFPLLRGLIDAERNFDEIMRRWPGAESVTALPSNPFDGQQVAFRADGANGVVWTLRYNATSASAYKWESVGGSAIITDALGDMTNANTSFTALTDGPSVTVPLAGDYETGLRVIMVISGASVAQAELFDDGVAAAPVLSAENGQATPSGFARVNGIGAGSVLDVRCANATAVSTRYLNARILVRPIRVG